jgi:hypothetical protein
LLFAVRLVQASYFGVAYHADGKFGAGQAQVFAHPAEKYF